MKIFKQRRLEVWKGEICNSILISSQADYGYPQVSEKTKKTAETTV